MICKCDVVWHDLWGSLTSNVLLKWSALSTLSVWYGMVWLVVGQFCWYERYECYPPWTNMLCSGHSRGLPITCPTYSFWHCGNTTLTCNWLLLHSSLVWSEAVPGLNVRSCGRNNIVLVPSKLEYLTRVKKCTEITSLYIKLANGNRHY
jgi:hypothetical protein